MLWFRFYHEALDDLKVQQLPPATFKHWVNLLCLANLTTPRGTLPNLATIAYRLRVSEPKAKALIDEFVSRDLLNWEDETLRPHNWESRQKRSDNVADRVAKHRSNVTDPLQETDEKRDGNVLEKSKSREELDTEQNRVENVSPPSPSSSGKPKPQRTIKTPIPDNLVDLIPAETWESVGRVEQQLTDEQLRFETALMIDHYAKKGERMVDWVAAWRSWMRSEYRQSKPMPPPEEDPMIAWMQNATVAPEHRLRMVGR